MKKFLIPASIFVCLLCLTRVSFDSPEPDKKLDVGRYQFFAHPTSETFYGFIDTREGLVLIMSEEDTTLRVFDLKYHFAATYKDYLKNQGLSDSTASEEIIWRVK